MLITVEQMGNNYPLNAVRFMEAFDKYLSDETDDYGIKKCNPDSFAKFKEQGADVSKLMSEYKQAVKEIHEYLDKGLQL